MWQTWFRSNVRCPLCRYDIREYRRGGGGALSRQNSLRRMADMVSANSASNVGANADASGNAYSYAGTDAYAGMNA